MEIKNRCSIIVGVTVIMVIALLLTGCGNVTENSEKTWKAEEIRAIPDTVFALETESSDTVLAGELEVEKPVQVKTDSGAKVIMTEKGSDPAGFSSSGSAEPSQTSAQDYQPGQKQQEPVQPATFWLQDEPDATVRDNAEQEVTAHVHFYELADTRAIDHPAVIEQVWMEDSQAWDEVVREGYHVSVVTCHECGAQFSGTSQAAALEAWGDHTDEVHDGDGGYDMASSYDVPAETVHHEAIGHYEALTVSAAWTEYIDTYRCLCGEQYTKTR